MKDHENLDKAILRLGQLPRAEAPARVLPKIIAGLQATRKLSAVELHAAIVAAVVVISLNVLAVMSYSAVQKSAVETDSISLVSNYQIIE